MRPPPAFAEFDLGQFLDIGLNTNEIGYLAGSLFLGLFGIAALRRATRAAGALSVVWITVAVALFGGCLVVAARGFPDYYPASIRPWTETHRIVPAGAVLALLGAALVLISGHWIRGALARWVCRVVGLAVAGLAVWLAAGWFAEDVPAEIRIWAVDTVIARGVVVLALLCLGSAFWVRQTWGTPHARWVNRALAPVAITIAVILAWRWFGSLLRLDVSPALVEQVVAVLGLVASGTCVLIALGAYAMHDRPKRKRVVEQTPVQTVQPLVVRPLPIATLLDDQGRPVAPKASHGRSGPAGA